MNEQSGVIDFPSATTWSSAPRASAPPTPLPPQRVSTSMWVNTTVPGSSSYTAKPAISPLKVAS